MRRTTAGLVLAVTVLAGCTAAGDSNSPTTTDAADGTAGPDEPADGTYDVDDPAVTDAIFLTAVDGVLEGTVHAGLADEAPGVLLATADDICDELDDGAAPDEVVTTWLDAFADATGEPATADDGTLAGALLGAGVEVFCPEHAQRLSAEEQP